MLEAQQATIPGFKIEFSPEEQAELLESYGQVLASGRLILGAFTERFEIAFARFIGSKFAVATNSGTSALEISLRSIGVVGSTVLVPTNTNFATGIAALNAGATLKLYDSGLQADVSAIESQLSSDVSVVLVVHIGGHLSTELDQIRDLCERRGIALVEDAAHAHGSEVGGKMAGTFGRASAFSFVATKVITTGEGGMVVTDDEKIAQLARRYRNQGYADDGVTHELHGNSWRMTELGAAMGLVQLGRLLARRDGMNAIIRCYSEALEGSSILSLVRRPKDLILSGYKCIAVASDGTVRNQLADRFRTLGVALTRGVYDVPLHKQPIFSGAVGVRQLFPSADDFASRHLCLPLWRNMEYSTAVEVAERISEVLRC